MACSNCSGCAGHCSCCIIRASREKTSQFVYLLFITNECSFEKLKISHQDSRHDHDDSQVVPNVNVTKLAGENLTQHTFILPAVYEGKHALTTHIPYSHICDDLWVCSFKWQALMAAVICVKVRLQGAGVGARGS